MKHLTLMRHAKSDWSDSSLGDIDRPLNERGRHAAPRMGAFMQEGDISPDLILCSSATRTRQTLELIAPFFTSTPEIVIDEAFYLAAPVEMLRAIKTTANERHHILMVGHNPGTHLLALDLIDPKRSDRHAVSMLGGKFPTAALAHFEFDCASWSDVGRGRGALKVFQTPKLLER